MKRVKFKGEDYFPETKVPRRNLRACRWWHGHNSDAQYSECEMEAAEERNRKACSPQLVFLKSPHTYVIKCDDSSDKCHCSDY